MDETAVTAPEAPVGLLDEVLQIHAVQAGQKGAHREAEGGDAELDIEEHQRVAVGVQNGADTGYYVSQNLIYPGELKRCS